MSFAGDIARWAEIAESTLEDATRAVRLQAVELVIEKTPVKTGQARGSIIASIGSPANSPNILDNTSGTAAAVARAQSAIAGPADSVFYFTSNLPYIGVLENGSSIQAPNGMFRISAIELRESIREIIRNAST